MSKCKYETVAAVATALMSALWSSGASAAGTTCANPSKALDQKDLDAIVTAWGCSVGRRCIDGHSGRSFIGKPGPKDTGKAEYIDGDKFFQRLPAGSPVYVDVFVRKECATDRLENVHFSWTKVVPSDSFRQEREPSVAESAKEKGNKLQATINKGASRIQRAKESASEVDPSTPGIDDVKNLLKDAGDFLTVKPKQATRLLQKAMTSLDRIADQAKSLESNAESPAAVRIAASQKIRAVERVNRLVETAIDDVDAVSTTAAEVAEGTSSNKEREPSPKTILTELDAEAKTGWRGTKVEVEGSTTEFAVKEFSGTVPKEDGVGFFDIHTQNAREGEKPSDGNAAVWPTNTLFIKVDHGRYYWDFGLLFTTVFDGGARFRPSTKCTAGDPTNCTRDFDNGYQLMFSGTIYPVGRRRGDLAVWNDPTRFVPGIQVGLNADVTKIDRAISLGIIEELVDGLGVSAGVMYHTRPLAPPSDNGDQVLEHMFHPYVGVTLNAAFYNTIVGIKNGTDGKSDQPK